MDSASNWSNSSIFKSEVWGNSSKVIGSSNSGSTESFAQNSDRSSSSSSSSSSSGNPGTAWNCSGVKILQVATNSNMMWPSSEISSKQDVGKWGMGLSGASGGGGGSQSGQNDPDSWRSGGANCWTSDEKNDISGWGSPNRSPVPHAGTDIRGSKAAQNDDQVGGWPADSRSNNGYLQPDPRQASSSWSETTADRSKQSQWGAAGNSSLGSASGAWSRGNPIMQPSQSVPTVGNLQSQQGAPNSWAQAVTNKSGQSAAGSGSCGTTAGAAAPDDSKASSLRRSQEELIAQAINSNDGWGKTAIRQDTAWVIEDTMIEQRKALSAQDATNDESAALLTRQMMTGTAIWESSKAASAAASRSAEKSAEDRSAWSGALVEKTNVVASNPANGPNPAMAVGSNPASAFRPPMDKPSANSWPPGPTDKPTGGWGTSSTSSEGSWEGPKKEDDRVWDLEINKGSKTETGVWDRPLRRSSSSGSWTGDEIENVGWGDDKPRQPPEVDDGTSVWGDPGNQNRPQNWKHSNKPPAGSSQLLGQRMRPDERGDGFFGAPPPSINLKPAAFGEQMENSVGPWNPSVPPPKPDSGGWGDGHWPNVTGPRPQKSASMSGAWDINDWMSGSRRQNDFPMSGVSGGKGPTPQRSVILQQLLSMGFRKEDAQNALISNNMNLESALSELLTSRLRPDPEVADHQRGRLLRPSDDLTSDSSLDTNSLLFGLPALGQLNNSPFNIAGGGGGANPQQALANQLRPGGPTSLQQAFGSSLGNQPSGLPDFTALLQRTNQVMNNSVLMPPHQQQQQLLMQQLMQNVQAAIQLGLLPSNLIKPQMLMNNNFVVNVQRLLQLYEMHQKLSEQCQLIQRQGSVLPSTTQQRLVEITITIVGLQQQIDQVKQQIIQMSSMPTSVGSLPPVDQLLKGLQVKDDGTAASRLMSQWKIDSDADIKSVQHSTSLDMPNTESTWMPMSSASSSSSWSGSAATAAAVEDSASIGSGGVAASGASLDAKVQSTVGIIQTSTLSSAITTISESAVASSSGSAAPASALDIEEFVPGKPWQGPSTKNVEDDPYITPGSVTRNSLSTINDIQVMNILGNKNNASGAESRSASSLGKPGLSQSLQSPAPHSNAWLSEPPPLLSVDPWGRNPALPPGLHIQNKPQWQYNRSVSWTPGDRSEYTSVMNNWSTAPSNWLLLRNLPPQVDSGTLHTLCMQHGPVLKFFPNVSRSVALVGYGKVEDAIKAQRSLHSCKFGNTQLMVDFVAENDVGHLLEANGRGTAQQPNSFVRPPMPSSLGSNYSGLHQGQPNRPELVGQWGGGGTAGGAGLGSAGSWNAMGAGTSWLPGFEDHSAAFLPGDLLGGQ